MSEEKKSPRYPHGQNRLKGPEQFKLNKLVEAFYTQKNISDEEFAHFAQEELGFPVSKANVQGAREACGIASTNARVPGQANIANRITALETKVAELESAVRVLMLAAKHNH